MSKYDFTSIPDRSLDGAAKWTEGTTKEFVPLSVADMEFFTAPEIKEALADLAQNSVLGYTDPTERYFDAVKSWLLRRHGFEVQTDWILRTPGVVTALQLLVEATVDEGEAVLILTPVYYPFDMSVMAKGRNIVYSKLINTNGVYTLDEEDFKKKCALPEVKALIISNPHNPVGKVWTKDELTFIGNTCLENGVFVIDDEIHNDLIMPGAVHTVLATISEEIKNNCAVCTAPSKTFNLAGLQCSNIIIPNKDIREKMQLCIGLSSGYHLNIFAYRACEAAYNKCEAWLDELIPIIKENADLVEGFMKENFPEVICSPLEGTYLQWIDLRKLGFTHEEMREILEGEKIFLDNGEMFGILGRGFQRINLACAKETLEKALIRFKNGVEKRREYEKLNGKPVHITLKSGVKFEDAKEDKKKKLVVFSRPLGSYFSKELFDLLDSFPDSVKENTYVFVPSAKEKVEKEAPLHTYELIPDENGDVFSKYNCFPCNSGVQLFAGDKSFEHYRASIVNKKPLFDTELLKFIFGENTKDGKYALALPVFAVLDEENIVTYAYYGETATDFPAREMLY